MKTLHTEPSGDKTFPRRIIAIVVTRIGDTLLCTPALRAIKAKWPDSTLTVVAHPKRMEVLANLPFIDHLQGFTVGRRWLSALLPKDYDLAFAFSNDRPVLRYAVARAKKVLAFRGGAHLGDSGIQSVDFPTSHVHAVQARLALVRAAGADTGDFRLAYAVTPKEAIWAKEWLKNNFPADTPPRIALQLCSFPTKAHRDWPIAHFARFIQLIQENYPSATFLVTGDALSASAAKELEDRSGASIKSAAGRLSLRQTAALLSKMDLYVGVDTGPTHLAGALGIPMVALYHAAYPGRYLAPLQNPQCVVIEHPATGQDDVREANMGDISPETVWEAAKPLLAEGT